MYKKVITLTEFILNEERNYKKATGSFTLLLTQIENAAKIIASHVKKTGLVDILGSTGKKNVYGDEVQKLDEYSNDILVDFLSQSGQVYMLASEELEDIHIVEKNSGDYIVFFDPLDGSSNIDANISIGTIFSIYHKNASYLQSGIKQVAAGYILYSSSVMFVYSFGNGVNGFTLDPSIGSFLLSHSNIKAPNEGNIYSINEGNYEALEKSDKKYLQNLKKNPEPPKLRYVGSMVADIHRTLFKGGIFMYPKDKNNPQGKLRLLFEVNPLSFIIKQAGGLAYSNRKDPLEITPKSLHQKAPIILGSLKNINDYISLTKKS